MNLAQAMSIADTVATQIEIKASKEKYDPMKCESCGEMGAACTCDKIAAGGPGSGRHAEAGTTALMKTHGYEHTGKEKGISTYKHPSGHTVTVEHKTGGWSLTDKHHSEWNGNGMTRLSNQMKAFPHLTK